MTDPNPFELIINRCVKCGIDMGENNPRQLCSKTWCSAIPKPEITVVLPTDKGLLPDTPTIEGHIPKAPDPKRDLSPSRSKPTDPTIDDGWKLWQSLSKNPPQPIEEIKMIFARHSIKEIKAWCFGTGHPILHQAAGQPRYVQADNVLLVAFEEPRLKVLFEDESYLDRYGFTVTRRLADNMKSLSVTRKKITDFFKIESLEYPFT